MLVDQSLADGITVKAWTFDELYGRDGKFLDGRDERNQAFIGEVPPDFTMWARKPKVLRKPSRNRNGRPRNYPRLAARNAKPCEVRNLCNYSPGLSSQTPQRYRVCDSHKGPEVWGGEVARWLPQNTQWPSGKFSVHARRRDQRTYRGGEILRWKSSSRHWWLDASRTAAYRLRTLEGKAGFREAKEELGWDHFECRGWGCVHRHLIVTIVTQLFCARVRHQLCPSEIVTDAERLTMEQVRRAADVFIRCMDLPPRVRQREYAAELSRMTYHQYCNAESSRCHRGKRLAAYHAIGIDPDGIKSVDEKSP